MLTRARRSGLGACPPNFSQRAAQMKRFHCSTNLARFVQCILMSAFKEGAVAGMVSSIMVMVTPHVEHQP